MKLYNTLTRTVDEITPLTPPKATVYTCGPTVYDYAHVGHWFNYVRMDTLIRTLRLSGFEPEWVMNITDVGHLVSDADEGEDKLEKGAKREGKTAWQIAQYYTDDFLDGMNQLNILTPNHIVKATDHIAEQIELIQRLEEKGYTYVIDDGVYYDTSKFEGYEAFARLDLDEQQSTERVAVNPQKRNQADFALWKFSPQDRQRDMEWWAPWHRPGSKSDEKHPIGMPRAVEASADHEAREQHSKPIHGSWGFPGWHIECSAMSMKYLGESLDIHTGGIDHVPVHHTNEIAQSEAATGKRFAQFWMHSNHIAIDGQKISKSLGNGITLQQVKQKDISPVALRLHVLESHYRTHSTFSWKSLEAARNRLRGYQAMAYLRFQPLSSNKHDGSDSQKLLFKETKKVLLRNLQNDLNTPKALEQLSTLETTLSETLLHQEAVNEFNDLLSFIDELLGLRLLASEPLNKQFTEKLAQRENARQQKDWETADVIRDELLEHNIHVRDTPKGQVWSRF